MHPDENAQLLGPGKPQVLSPSPFSGKGVSLPTASSSCAAAKSASFHLLKLYFPFCLGCQEVQVQVSPQLHEHLVLWLKEQWPSPLLVCSLISLILILATLCPHRKSGPTPLGDGLGVDCK